MTIKVEETRTTLRTTLGNQDITTADLGGLTPKAALFIVNGTTADGVAAAHDVSSFGVADGTRAWAMCCSNQDNVASVSSGVLENTGTLCVYLIDPTDARNPAAVVASFTVVGFIANGVTINGVATTAYEVTVVFFAGDDTSAYTNVFTLDGTSGNTVDISTVGFEPGVLITFGGYTSFVWENVVDLRVAYGFVLNSDPVRQYCMARSSDHEAAAGAPAAMVSDDYGIFWVDDAGDKCLAGEFGSFDAEGFSCTTRVASVADIQCGYLALAFNGKAQFNAGIIDSPTATGEQVITAPGFKPQFVMALVNRCEAVETGYATSLAGSTGISVFDANEAYCNSNQDEDGADPTDTQSLSDNVCVNLPYDDGSAGIAATFVSFDETGWTWNFSSVSANAKKFVYLAIERTFNVWLVASAGGKWWYRQAS